MTLYNIDLLQKLVKQSKRIRDRSYAEKEGKEYMQAELTEHYKPIIENQKEIDKTQSTKLENVVTKLDESKTESNVILNEIKRRITTGNVRQIEQGNKLVKTIENRPVLIELIKTVTPNLGKVLVGEADIKILTKAEKKILTLYDEIDDADIKTLIDYYAYMKQPITQDKGQAEISDVSKAGPTMSDEPHPAEIASQADPPDPPAYDVGGFQNEFQKGENRNYVYNNYYVYNNIDNLV